MSSPYSRRIETVRKFLEETYEYDQITTDAISKLLLDIYDVAYRDGLSDEVIHAMEKLIAHIDKVKIIIQLKNTPDAS